MGRLIFPNNLIPIEDSLRRVGTLFQIRSVHPCLDSTMDVNTRFLMVVRNVTSSAKVRTTVNIFVSMLRKAISRTGTEIYSLDLRLPAKVFLLYLMPQRQYLQDPPSPRKSELIVNITPCVQEILLLFRE